MEKDLFELELENGEKKEFYKLAEFRSIKTNKDYVMFIDKERNNDNIYVNIIKNVDGVVSLEKIESDEDKEECQKALDELKERLSKKE